MGLRSRALSIVSQPRPPQPPQAFMLEFPRVPTTMDSVSYDTRIGEGKGTAAHPGNNHTGDGSRGSRGRTSQPRVSRPCRGARRLNGRTSPSPLAGRPKPQDETFDPARNASLDSPPRKSLETITEGRTSPELYSGPFEACSASSTRLLSSSDALKMAPSIHDWPFSKIEFLRSPAHLAGLCRLSTPSRPQEKQ
jgi:hypothetical protein